MTDTQPAAQEPDFKSMDPEQVTGLVSSATDEQLREALDGPQREAILGEVFRRMEEHFRPASAQGVDAVVHWKIGGAPGGGYDHYEVVVREGTCTTTAEPAHEPRVTLALDGVDFMRLVTGNASGPALFMTGRLKIQGDLMFSARIQSLFTIPG